MDAKVQVREGYYVTEKYASLNRFISYFFQIDAVRKAAAKKILFVGVGDNVVVDFLRRSGGYDITTMDIDAALQPDTLGDVREIPFPDSSFDIACVFEVLEHMPFADTEKALGELARVVREGALISVPHRRTGFDIVFRFPFIKTLTGREYIRLALFVPVRFPGFEVSGQHYWEIDGRTTTLRRFRDALTKHFTIQSEHTPVLDSYRRFFALQKK